MARWVAIWFATSLITAAEMAEYARPEIERAQGEGRESAVVTIGSRVISLVRFQVYLPVLIESPDQVDANGFMQAIEERVFEGRLN